MLNSMTLITWLAGYNAFLNSSDKNHRKKKHLTNK